MAEGDKPAMGTLPAELTKLIKIEHPNYQGEFEDLGLNWHQFPALARLGFDIGGVQYTASPFMGWWMDAGSYFWSPPLFSYYLRRYEHAFTPETWLHHLDRVLLS
jgi:hypothetical protein